MRGAPATPANAIIIHFRARAVRPVSWADVVAAALAPARQRDQWLVGARRSDHASWLTDRHVAFALRRVVAELGGATVTPQ